MTDYPCRYCPKRHPGCHSGCEAYQAVKQARDSAREAERAGRKRKPRRRTTAICRLTTGKYHFDERSQHHA